MNSIIYNPGKTGSRMILLLFILCCAILSQGQKTKGTLQLADEYFAAGEYYTAAGLYGQYLNPPKKQKPVSEFPLNVKGKRTSVSTQGVSRADIVFKQAESYRLANYWNEAAELYKQCAEENPGQFINALYWYAVCKRNLGDYKAAIENLQQFIRSPGISKQDREASEKELQTLQFILRQLARADSILFTVKKLEAENSSESGYFGMAPLGNNQFLVSSTRSDSVREEGVNPYHSRLFTATLNNDRLDNLKAIPVDISDGMDNLGAASMSSDGKYLYFSQWKKENGHTVSVIYYSEKTANGWGQPRILSTVNVKGYNAKQPFCTSDGKYLFFVSNRPGGAGKYDIWYVPLKGDGSAGTPVNAGSLINTPGDEAAPFYHNSSNTLVFSSNGYPGMGGYDFFAAKGGVSSWRMPENLGSPVNSSRDDVYFYAPENSPLLSNVIFSSDRGSGCCLETYKLSKAPKNRILTGILYDCNDNSRIEGAAVTLTDISGKTWKAVTGVKGEYRFDLLKENFSSLSLSFTKEDYKDAGFSSAIQRTDESDLLTDKLINADLCIERIPEPEPEPVLVIKAEDVVTVYFDFDKSLLKPEAIHKLDSIYQVLQDHPAATIQISGYTDGLGSDAYNAILSDKRARACADYLRKKGIETERITFVSFGACCPVEMEIINGRDNPDGRSRNRRALINVKKE